MKQIKLLLISEDASPFEPLVDALEKQQIVHVDSTRSTERALRLVENNEIEAVIVDEHLEGTSGLDFVNELVRCNPFVNCALVSSLQPAEFHEATEGLGVFMQLKGRPSLQEATSISAQISDHLNKIYRLVSSQL